jgi:hypothetical protein
VSFSLSMLMTPKPTNLQSSFPHLNTIDAWCNLSNRAGGGFWSWSLGQRAAFKSEFPHLAGGATNQTQLLLKDNTAVPWWKQQLWPPCMSWLSYLTSQFPLLLWKEGTNTTHNPVTCWDYIRASASMPIPGLDT